MTDISVIVSTYNRPDALDATLRSLSRQAEQEFRDRRRGRRIGAATRDLVRTWAAKLDIPLRHVWQEDRGFRLAEIRNRAIAASAGDYLIFLDGDCMARPDFVAAHRALAEPGFFVGGNRVLLSRQLTEDILARQSRTGALEPRRVGARTARAATSTACCRC